MRAHLSYLDRINNLERQNARRERQAKEGGSDEEGGSDGGEEDEEGSKSAQAIAARKAKKAAAADKKRQNDEVKNINVSVKSSGAGGDDAGAGGARGAGGDVKTGRAAASLFGPMKAAAEEDWVDLPFHDPMVSGRVLSPSFHLTPLRRVSWKAAVCLMEETDRMTFLRTRASRGSGLCADCDSVTSRKITPLRHCPLFDTPPPHYRTHRRCLFASLPRLLPTHPHPQSTSPRPSPSTHPIIQSEGANRVYEQLFASNQANLKMLTKATQYLRL